MSDFDHVPERVPPFRPRVGDSVLEGSNNSLLVLGRDRPGAVSSGLGAFPAGTGAGTAHLAVGRGSADVSLKSDAACLYLSMRTSGDENLGTGVEGAGGIASLAALRADQVRLAARVDLKLVVDGQQTYLQLAATGGVLKVGGSGELRFAPSSATLDAPAINLGKDAPHAALRGTPYASAEQTFLTALQAWATAVSSGVIPAAQSAVTPAMSSLAAALSSFVPAQHLSQVVRTV